MIGAACLLLTILYSLTYANGTLLLIVLTLQSCRNFVIILHMDGDLQKIKTTLKNAHHSATRSRLKVFVQLATYGPARISGLAQALQNDLDRATVYRTIDLFEKLGIVNRVWQGFKHQVELSEVFTPHHHHAVCQNCGRTIDIASSELEASLAHLAKRHGFLAVSHSVEVSGYCKQCQ